MDKQLLIQLDQKVSVYFYEWPNTECFVLLKLINKQINKIIRLSLTNRTSQQ